MSYSSIKPGAVISFTPRSTLQGTSVENVRVLATLSYHLAKRNFPNLDDMHNQAYAEIHNMNVLIGDDPSSYDYFMIETMDNARKEMIFGFPWVDPNSIVEVGSTNATLTISNVTPTLQQAVVDAISQLGVKVESFRFTS
jgi:hypothetical protein